MNGFVVVIEFTLLLLILSLHTVLIFH